MSLYETLGIPGCIIRNITGSVYTFQYLEKDEMRVAGRNDCFGDHKQTPADCLPVDFHTFYGGAFTAFLCRSGIGNSHLYQEIQPIKRSVSYRLVKSLLQLSTGFLSVFVTEVGCVTEHLTEVGLQPNKQQKWDCKQTHNRSGAVTKHITEVGL